MSYQTAQQINTRRALLFWVISVALALPVVSLIVVAPVAAASGQSEVARGIYGAFAIFCHQLPERSYFLGDHKFAVCSRCTGIYVGFALTLLLYPLLRSLKNPVSPPRSWLLLAVVPLAIDFSVNFFGFWHNTHTSRLLTGAVLGSAVVFFVVPAIIELSSTFLRTPPNTKTRLSFTPASAAGIASAPSDYSAPERRIP